VCAAAFAGGCESLGALNFADEGARVRYDIAVAARVQERVAGVVGLMADLGKIRPAEAPVLSAMLTASMERLQRARDKAIADDVEGARAELDLMAIAVEQIEIVLLTLQTRPMEVPDGPGDINDDPAAGDPSAQDGRRPGRAHRTRQVATAHHRRGGRGADGRGDRRRAERDGPRRAEAGEDRLAAGVTPTD
jgi:hypothetical protein